MTIANGEAEMKQTKRTANKSVKSGNNGNTGRMASSSSTTGSGRGATSRTPPATRGRPAPIVRELSSAMADALEDILRAERFARMS